MLKVGIIGCGQIAQSVHLKILSRLPEVQLIALAEPDAQRRETASQMVPQAIAYSDYQQLLNIPEVEAVVICLPNLLHADAAIAACQKGKHVYLDKPLATNLSEAQQVLEAWHKADVVGMIGFNYRFNRLYQAMKRSIQSSRLGEVVSVRTVFSTTSKDYPSWKLNRQTGGGVLLDLACHHLDLIRFCFEQEVREVFAQVHSLRSEDDSAWIQLRLENGLLVQSFFSLNAAEEDRVEIYGSQAKLTVDHFRSLDVEIADVKMNRFNRLQRIGQKLKSLNQISYVWEKLRSPNNEPSYQMALMQFITAIQNHQSVSPNFEDGYRTQMIIDALEKSARTERVVSLPPLVADQLVNL